MDENRFDSKKLLIITGYILIVLIDAGMKNNINYKRRLKYLKS